MRPSALIMLLCILASPLSSAAFCFEEAGKMYAVDPLLLYCIAQVESGFKTAAIHYNKNKNGGIVSYDYGVMQINTWWYSRLGQASWAALGDPCHNVKVGAWILAQNIRQYGDIWEAVGYYNAKTKAKRERYIKKVSRVFQSLKSR